MAARTDWRARLALIAACIILTAWTGSFVADVAIDGYDPHPSITPMALATVGWLFGGEVMTRLRPPRPDHEEIER